jgi:hypothetical protein
MVSGGAAASAAPAAAAGRGATARGAALAVGAAAEVEEEEEEGEEGAAAAAASDLTSGATSGAASEAYMPERAAIRCWEHATTSRGSSVRPVINSCSRRSRKRLGALPPAAPSAREDSRAGRPT